LTDGTIVAKTTRGSGETTPESVARADNFLPGISAWHLGIDRALEFDPKSSWHARGLRGSKPDVTPPQKKQSLTPRSTLAYVA
jgi:hypothetical protein